MSTIDTTTTVERRLDVGDLSEGALLDVLRTTDPDGVLTITAGPTLAERARALRALAALEPLRPGGGWRLERAVERLGPVLAQPGAGAVVVAPVGAPDVVTVVSALPLPARAALAPVADVRPLLELVEASRPAGIAIASDAGAELLDWGAGAPRTVARVTGAPELAAAEVHRLAEERGWEQLVVAGAAAPLLAALPDRLRAVAIVAPGRRGGLPPARLAAAVAGRLRRARAAAALAPGMAHGLAAVAAALNEARAAHVVYDPEIGYAGAVAEDGSLLAWGAERLTGRIVERALETGARLTPVDAAATPALADAGGIAARLRW